MFTNWISDIKLHIFAAGVALMLVVGFFTKLQLIMALLAFHYAIELVIKYDNRIIQVIGYFRERQRKRRELGTVKSVQEHKIQQEKWVEQIGKKPN